ncbi:MAG TPA: zinc ribbon domain-containing protein, partial [Candidatus Dormibacteraeota bacterium]|nr:zinc ribbon domain-containing protein [Candidatus Dormibacteraeota bacterium]
ARATPPSLSPIGPRPPTPPTSPTPEARLAEAIPPAPPGARPTPVVAPPVEPQESGVFCSRCGTPNDLRRHFCRRCGAPLAQAAARRVPWWRRLFPQRQAPAAGQRHAPVREVTIGSLLRTFIVTLLVVLLAGGLLAYLTVPGFHLAVNQRVDTGFTQLRRQFGTGIVEVHPVGAQGSSELSGHPARFAADLINNDYWAVDTSRDRQPTLVCTFDGPTDLDYLLVINGAPDADYSRIARPRTVQLVYSDGTGEELTLNDDPKATSYLIHARQVTSVTLRVTSVYPAAGSTTVALTEVEFYHLK